MTKPRVNTSFPAHSPRAGDLRDRYPGLVTVRYYTNRQTGETFKTVEVRLENGRIEVVEEE